MYVDYAPTVDFDPIKFFLFGLQYSSNLVNNPISPGIRSKEGKDAPAVFFGEFEQFVMLGGQIVFNIPKLHVNHIHG